MYFLMFLTVLDWIAMFVHNPVNPMTWFALGMNITFLLRKFGIHIKVTKIIPAEVLFMFLYFNGSLVFKTFTITNYIIMIIIRIVFYLIVYYDDTAYVYITEEVEKEM